MALAVGIVFGVFLVIIQICVVFYYVRKINQKPKKSIVYNADISITDRMMRMLQDGAIKKHTISNSALKYNVKNTTSNYKVFLGSELMNEIQSVCEELKDE